MIYKVLLTLTFILYVRCGSDCCKKLKSSGAFPKFADGTKSFKLRIKYGDKEVSCGDPVNFLKTTVPPKLYFDAPCDKLTVVAIIPDTPLFPPHLLWLFYNVPSDCLRRGFSGDCGDEGAYYGTPASPASKRGALTIIFFLYCQKGVVAVEKKELFPQRNPFDVRGHAERQKLGCPVATNFCTFTLLDKPIEAADAVPVKDPEVQLPIDMTSLFP